MEEKTKAVAVKVATEDNLRGQLIRFGMVGVINTIVGCSIMFGLYNFAGCSYWLSSATNYVLMSILSFFLNRYITFHHKGNMLKSAVRFAMSVAASYLIAYSLAKPLMLWLLAEQTKVIQENVAMAVGMVLYVLLNFTGQKLFAFKKDN